MRGGALEERTDDTVPLFRVGVLEKRERFEPGRNAADKVEIGAWDEGLVAGGSGRLDAVGFPRGGEEFVDAGEGDGEFVCRGQLGERRALDKLVNQTRSQGLVGNPLTAATRWIPTMSRSDKRTLMLRFYLKVLSAADFNCL